MPDTTRRKLIQATLLGAAAAGIPAGQAAGKTASPVTSGHAPGIRHWLGPELWGNRLQDWRSSDGRIECLRGGKGEEVRTVGLLTRDIIGGASAGRISVTTGLLTPRGRPGYAGFLIGVGNGKLDPRAAALAQSVSGAGGGFMAVMGSDGRIQFLDHTDEDNIKAFAPLASDEKLAGAPVAPDQKVRLTLQITPVSGGFDVELTAADVQSGTLIASAVRRAVSDRELIGGLSLVSSTETGTDGARWWFSDIATEGAKVAVHQGRALGPVLGTLYSLNKGVLKLSAQFMPIGTGDPQNAELYVRSAADQSWKKAASAAIEHGYTALFRVENWNSIAPVSYQVRYSIGGKDYTYDGTVRREPDTDAALSIGLFSCVKATARALDRGRGYKELPTAKFLGRYTPENFYFPYGQLIENSLAHDPDMLVFCGDQFYERNPTNFSLSRDSGEDLVLDMLYKWYLWMWSFRDMTRDRPTLLLVDDHDVYHGNIWGQNGDKTTPAKQHFGGYAYPPEFVNAVQRTQCSHNPDAYDPTPIQQGISTYYCAFSYGGVSFALLEDRKFKTSPIQRGGLEPHKGVLLGQRQENFLAAWKDMDHELPKVVLTQTVWASVQTMPDGDPMIDYDSNGYPPAARDKALELVRDAGALMLSGDQHLGTLIRHGIEDYDDGPVQFSGPAGMSFWQRWYEPLGERNNPRPDVPYSGESKDGFGNPFTALAVANPKISFAEYRKHVSGSGQAVNDRNLKREGYGIIRIDKKAQKHTIECWSWDEEPKAAGASQFDGWPYSVSFSEAGRKKASDQ